MLIRTIVLFAVVGCCWHSPLYSQTIDSSVESELRAAMTERHRAGVEGDVEKIASSMTDDYLQTDIYGHVQDKATWLNEYFVPLAGLIETGKFRWEVYDDKDVQIRVDGNMAVVIGSLELKGTGARPNRERHTWEADPNAGFSGKLRFTHVYVKRNGKWLLAAVHNAAPLPPVPLQKGADTPPTVAETHEREAKSSPQMEKLIQALAGEWSSEETYAPNDQLPKGGKGRSRDTYRPGPARMSLLEEYHSEGDAGSSWGTGIIWWDEAAQGFHFVWCDTYALDRGCHVSAALSGWEGNEYVGRDERDVAGKEVFEKEIWSNFTANSFTQILFTGEAPDRVTPFLTIKAKRVR